MSRVDGYISLVVLCLFLSFHPWSTSAMENPRGKLLHDLLMSYDKRICPGELDSGHTDLVVGVSLISIVNLDPKTRIMESVLWLHQQYSDPRLTWNPYAYGNITVLRVPHSDVWTPDLVFYKAVDRPLTLSTGKYNILVYSSGEMHYIPGFKVKTRCKPTDRFDEITCSWKLGSWVYDGSLVNVKVKTNAIDLVDFAPVDSPAWNITESKLWREEKKYPCCDEIYPAVYGEIKLRRNV